MQNAVSIKSDIADTLNEYDNWNCGFIKTDCFEVTTMHFFLLKLHDSDNLIFEKHWYLSKTSHEDEVKNTIKRNLKSRLTQNDVFVFLNLLWTHIKIEIIWKKIPSQILIF